MTKVQTIIKEINELNRTDLELVLQEILRKIDKEKLIHSIIDEYIGIGEGIWQTDAQEYVNKLRQEEE